VPEQSGPKSVWGGCCAPFRGGELGPHPTRSPGPRLASVPSGILIDPTVWPQYTNVIDRQDRQDRHRSGSIRRTVLQTVAQKQIAVIIKPGPEVNIHLTIQNSKDVAHSTTASIGRCSADCSLGTYVCTVRDHLRTVIGIHWVNTVRTVPANWNRT